MLFIANSTIGSQNNSVELSQSNQTTRILIISWFKHVLSDPYVSMVFEWLMTPVVISFILPLVFCLIIWASSLVLYVHKYHKRRLMRRLREAVNERDIVIAGREIIAALWDAQVIVTLYKSRNNIKDKMSNFSGLALAWLWSHWYWKNSRRWPSIASILPWCTTSRLLLFGG